MSWQIFTLPFLISLSYHSRSKRFQRFRKCSSCKDYKPHITKWFQACCFNVSRDEHQGGDSAAGGRASTDICIQALYILYWFITVMLSLSSALYSVIEWLSKYTMYNDNSHCKSWGCGWVCFLASFLKINTLKTEDMATDSRGSGPILH